MSSLNSPESFHEFISRFESRLEKLFSTTYTGKSVLSPGMPEGFIEAVLETNPLSVFVPSRFGGRDQKVSETLAMLETASYHSLPLSLTLGINGALFLQPLSKYGPPEVQQSVFSRFMTQPVLGGLMITEPLFGSEALQMQTRFRREGEGFRIQGTKHWGGLTGQADFWLLTARGETPRGDLERSISFFVWERSFGGITVEERYNNLGLSMIPYGRNHLDTVVPESHRLHSPGSGLVMLLDLLHRSRLQFPGMALGFLHRLLDEAILHTRNRQVGGRSLMQYDQVQDRLAEIQAFHTTAAALCVYSSQAASVSRDCSSDGIAANAVKTVVTDMMQQGAQSLLQLFGATGYRKDHIAGQALVDSRPFQIFEGSNDILYHQITEAILKALKKSGEHQLGRFLGTYPLTAAATPDLGQVLNFSPSPAMDQRKRVALGRALGRIICLNQVLALGDRGYRPDLIDNAVAVLKEEIHVLLAVYTGKTRTTLVEEYHDGSNWLDYL
ncbi:Acyl-CoA dehydrogenase [Alkalispirochaeta americana]|uniref:Acyl-CoA dehydrogenase n=1 Tax=Alkalispirochaeta americana TaxID=159291 RepID=A0A1N6QE03_9SPIO|nr:acyl-CoA dehydrogenase [Alkalispirochaeta americana]SIQ14827.1 Acyl-CoA dehydrogenase [Alkalispirochaeta americana]